MGINREIIVLSAARMADAWFINPHSTVETIRKHIEIYNAELKAVGKPAPKELPAIKEVTRGNGDRHRAVILASQSEARASWARYGGDLRGVMLELKARNRSGSRG